VDRAGAVDPLQPSQELENESPRLGLGEAAREAGPVDELRDEEKVPGRLVGGGVPDLDDELVAAAGREAAGLADHRAEEAGRAAEPLYGDDVTGREVARLGHDAVRALLEHLQLLVVADAPELVPRDLVAGRRRAGGPVGRRALPRRRRYEGFLREGRRFLDWRAVDGGGKWVTCQ
jgi:hypothetical protein